ncbi:MAG TPA: thioredoxin family protein, partial [Rubrivivax sp.]|nr:thioredoxin family protein [Rubrivivax sp.]
LEISAVVTDSSGTGAPAPGPATASQPAALALWQAALFAFLGGLILNLMPCVFPVLAIKATSVARLSGGALREVRLAGLFYTLGVLTAFTVLASALLAVRAGGTAVGWGFQFQAPWFVMAMAWLLLAIGLNMSGVYEIGGRLSGAGQSLTAQRGHRGSFFTGLLAVVVATPCTAPFMGAALGAALAAPPPTALGLFLAMGCGLALPYALLGVFPQAARWLPRPGGWMVLLRQGMAFLMYASAAWLIWVLSRQAGDTGVLAALAGAVLIGLAAWLYGLVQQGVARPWLPRSASVLALLGTVALLPLLSDEGGGANVQHVAGAGGGTAAATNAGFEAYSHARLAQLRAEGRPVFVNMTAAWCITCLVNERTALSTEGVRQAMAQHGIVYMKGDWTNRDPAITKFLQGFGRDGLPFYVLYPPHGAEPVLLPPVLTEGLLRSTFATPASS